MSARVACALVIAAGLGLFGVASAETKASCELIEISATTAKDPFIDNDVKVLEKKLKKPPFSSWNSFKVLSRVTKTVIQNKPEATKLARGTATILMSNMTTAKPARISLSLTVDDQDGKRVLDTKLSSDAGEWLVVGRAIPKSNDGELLALSCN